ncbi:cytochrome P450 [Archangium gephyra]|uniref:Cytochrome P450 n=1 Tax=Archangium gephyra TaxID=48 RepID=A0AAC8QCB6_9BACT|nr:cytochrome P450 [Archangium gephyra]AKJ04799.1 Cytochrome P450 family protein [Archangium gephyra]REG37152.1 cytochrome P450 [Archangium gephyra]
MEPNAPEAAPHDVRDWRDHAAFFLNLSRLCPDEVVPYMAQGRPAFLINRPEHVTHVLSTAQANYRNPYHPYAELAGLYQPEGSFLLRLGHRAEHRSAYTHQLTRMVESARARFRVLGESSSQGPVEVERELKELLLCVFAQALFGVDVAAESESFVRAVGLLEEVQANHVFARGADTGPLRLRYQQAVEDQQRLVERIVQGSTGMREAVEEAPERHSLVHTAIIRTLLNGYNAMATALGWTLHLLGQHPETQRQVREEALGLEEELLTIRDLPRLRVTRCVVQESLRLYPPAWMLGRHVREEERLGGITLPTGAIISVSPYTMQRHPRVWEEPDAFRPERFLGAESRQPGAYFPFGGGMRSCPAEHSVVGPLQLLVATLVREHQIEPVPGVTVRPRGLVSLRPSPTLRLRFLSLA